MNNKISEIANSSYFGANRNQKVQEEAHLQKQIYSPLQNLNRQTDGNICTIDQLGELLTRITELAWGNNWGVISPELSNSENPEDIKLPQITYSTNSREVAEKHSIKPVLSETIPEIVNGKRTGDYFQIHRQWFDCIIEFNFWGRSTLEAKELMERFEELMVSYAGKIKKLGVAEMFFLKEINPKTSLMYRHDIPMKADMFFFRLEKIYKIRQNSIKDIKLSTKISNVVPKSSNLYTNNKTNL